MSIAALGAERHSFHGGARRRLDLIARHAVRDGTECRLTGGIFTGKTHLPSQPLGRGLIVGPNPPHQAESYIELGPLSAAPAPDTVVCLLRGLGEPGRGPVLIEVQGRRDTGEILHRNRLLVPVGAEVPVFVPLRESGRSVDRLHVVVPSDKNDLGDDPAVAVLHIVAYVDNELTRVFNEMGSDKGTAWSCGEGVPHCYTLDYADLFEPLRIRRRFDLLEIGLDAASRESGRPVDAPSLRAWHRYFPEARLFGFDLHDFGFFRQSNTRVFQGDQSSRADLGKVVSAWDGATLGLVIDDGSHASSHQQITLATLFSSVDAGGLYVIEDLDWQPFAEPLSTLSMLREFQRTGRVDSPYLSGEESRALERQIDKVDLYRPHDSHFAAIRRRG